MPTALLICLENTFWTIDNFNFSMKLFEKSFTSYVESGMRGKVEAAMDILLRDEQGASGWTVNVTNIKEFERLKEKFCNLVVEHFLRTFIFSICTGQI